MTKRFLNQVLHTSAGAALTAALLLAITALADYRTLQPIPAARPAEASRDQTKQELIRLVADGQVSLVDAADQFEVMDAGAPVIGQQLLQLYPSRCVFESRCRQIAEMVKRHAAATAPAEADQVAERVDEQMQDEGYDVGG